MNDAERFAAAVTELDRLNAQDPTHVLVGGVPTPRELAKAARLTAWVLRLDPDASTPLRLAARAQHLMRFRVPRSEFPEGRTGYLTWRKHAARFHADQAESVLRAVGYADDVVQAVRAILLKQGLGKGGDVATMEDALCLSFLEHELDAFARGQSEDKVLGILRDTWKKMSERGREAAVELVPRLSPRARELVERALAG